MTEPRRITLRTEVDLLAMVPSTFGFHPEHSLVMVTHAARPGPGPCHARIDLPADPVGLPDVVHQLVFAAVRSGADRALLVAYTDDAELAELAVDLLVSRLRQSGVETVVAIRADGASWFPLGVPDDPRSDTGVPYDLRSHLITSETVLEGKVTYRNRRELAESLEAADPAEVDRVAAAAARLGPLPPSGARLEAEGQWLVTEVGTCLATCPTTCTATGPGLPVETAARVLRAVADHELRDLVWCEMTRDSAPAHVMLWRDLVRRAPEPLAGAAAGVLAFAAWLAGDGALAWCAVERSLAANPDTVLARLVAQALESATPPSCWRPVDRALLRLGAG
jgi:hypothetical protein